MPASLLWLSLGPNPSMPDTSNHGLELRQTSSARTSPIPCPLPKAIYAKTEIILVPPIPMIILRILNQPLKIFCLCQPPPHLWHCLQWPNRPFPHYVQFWKKHNYFFMTTISPQYLPNWLNHAVPRSFCVIPPNFTKIWPIVTWDLPFKFWTMNDRHNSNSSRYRPEPSTNWRQ